MINLILKTLLVLLAFYQVHSAKPCVSRAIPGADSVCVCNQTYCDEFAPLEKPPKGSAIVFESGKRGNRFVEATIKVDTSLPNVNPQRTTQTITINRSKQYQKILGFGGSFTDVTGNVLNELPKSLSDSVISSLFGANGLQYNMARVPMGATDYSYRFYTYDDVNDDTQLTHFALANEDHKFKIPHIKSAKALSPGLRLICNPWYAPKWMKTPTSNPKDTRSQLKGSIGGQYYDIWAKYFAKFVDAYKKEGVDVWAVTTQNEPSLGHEYDWLFMSAEMEREFVKKLGPALAQAGHDKTNILINDDNINTGLGSMSKYVGTILADQTAAKYVNGIAFHWYASSKTDDSPANVLDEVHQQHPNMFTVMTEASHLDGMGNGRWDYGEDYAHDIIRNMNHWSGGWIEWNMVLPLKGCPGNESGRCGPGLFSSVIQVDLSAKEAFKQPAYYALGHFSRFLVADSVRVDHTVDKNVDKLWVLTGQRPDGAVVVVALNRNDKPIDLRIVEGNNHLAHTIPERSIQTFIWE